MEGEVGNGGMRGIQAVRKVKNENRVIDERDTGTAPNAHMDMTEKFKG
jgi:hypothetical protein